MSPDRVRRKRPRGSNLTAQPPPRRANRVFYAVAEGRVTEYGYLTMLQNAFSARCSFRIDMPRPGSRSDKMKPSRVVERALAVANEDARRPRSEQYSEIWALLDRDQHEGVAGRCTHRRGAKSSCGPLDQDPSSGMWGLLESLGVADLLA